MESLIKQISKTKHEPKWMLELRLEGLKNFQKMPLPNWGPDLTAIDFGKINYFIKPAQETKRDWSQVPQKTKEIFAKLGIPQAERRVLSGVGAQWNSGIVYQSLKEKLKKQGVIFAPMDEAIKQYPDLIRPYFMKAIAVDNNKFSALHAAVWSGGVFVYLPEGVKIKQPLEGYFWLNLKQGGQFEHTIIIAEEGSELTYIEGCSAPRFKKEALHVGCVEVFVKEKARVKFFTIQNWSKNVVNLGMKRAIIEKAGVMEWVSAALGSQITMSYPASILKGDGAKAGHLSLSLAGQGQELDTGGQIIHLGENTSGTIISKSICQNGGRTAYRGLVKMIKGAKKAKASVSCDSLILGKKSRAATFPALEIGESDVVALHEAKTGKISEEELFYLMSRGLSETEATSLIINGFCEAVVKNLPLEYAVEINRLIDFYAEHSKN